MSQERQLRVALADDSVIYRRMLREALEGVPGVELVGQACDGHEALSLVRDSRPDVLLLDIEMPGRGGLEVLRELRPSLEGPAIVVISGVHGSSAAIAMEALQLGAVEFVEKPLGADAEDSLSQLRERLGGLMDGFRRRQSSGPQPEPAAQAPTGARLQQLGAVRGVVIGCSLGGPGVLARILPSLPARFGSPVVVAQHMPAGFTSSLAQTLGSRCAVPVREAADGDAVRPGQVLIAPGGCDTELLAGAPVRVRVSGPRQGPRASPSVDVLFSSAARVWGSGALGVILTGMGQDGLSGAREIRHRGGYVLAQDACTALAHGMPGAVATAGLADEVVPLERVPARVVCLGIAAGSA